jgi:hypothetical protein
MPASNLIPNVYFRFDLGQEGFFDRGWIWRCVRLRRMRFYEDRVLMGDWCESGSDRKPKENGGYKRKTLLPTGDPPDLDPD